MADDIITSVVAGLLIAAISAIAAGLWHQLKKPALADRRRGDPKVGA